MTIDQNGGRIVRHVAFREHDGITGCGDDFNLFGTGFGEQFAPTFSRAQQVAGVGRRGTDARDSEQRKKFIKVTCLVGIKIGS